MSTRNACHHPEILLNKFKNIFASKKVQFYYKKSAKDKGTRQISMFIFLYEFRRANSLHHQNAKNNY